MKWFLYLISFLMIGGGAWMILYTDKARAIVWDLLEQINGKIYGAIAIVFGILFLASASESYNTGFIAFLGLLLVADGVVAIINPKEIYEKCAQWLLNEATDQTSLIVAWRKSAVSSSASAGM